VHLNVKIQATVYGTDFVGTVALIVTK